MLGWNKQSCLCILAPLLLLMTLPTTAQTRGDLILENVYEAAIDLPRIYFVVQRAVNGPPLVGEMGFQPHFAFLDTGASGILMSRESAQMMGFRVEPRAQFMDIGVGGQEAFGVSEVLNLGIAGYHIQNPSHLRQYRSVGRGRFQIKQTMGSLMTAALDVIGMPAMVGRVVILDTGATNQLGHFAADIRAPGAPGIPPVHLGIKLRLHQFNNTQDPGHIPPLPVLAPNPVIDNVVLLHRGRTSRATWLFDTGGTISLISTRQAQRLGLVDAAGQELVKPAFSLPVGGIGHMTMIPGFQIDRLVVPTVSGRNVVYVNARIGVHDITYTDPETKTPRTLDGVFGSNFLCASARMAGLLPSDTSETLFDKVVVDFPKGLLGLRLR